MGACRPCPSSPEGTASGAHASSDPTGHGRVDTHLDLHVAAVVTRPGGCAAPRRSRPRPAAMSPWAERYGPVERLGVEGTGTYGAGLARFVRASGLEAVEVNRPDRSLRRRRGKSDPIDAQAAARATLAGVAATTPRPRGQGGADPGPAGGPPGALKARVAAAEQLYGVRYSAPEELRAPCWASRPRPWSRPAPPCGQDRSPAPPPPPRPPCGSWLGAGSSSRPNSTSSTASSRPWSPRPRPRCWPCPGSGSTPPGSCWSSPTTTPNGCAPRPPSPTCAAPPRSPPPRAAPTATG
jgi:hypothetical protein